MCGIAGIVSLSDRGVELAELQAMCSAMVHRGPNSGGAYVGPGVALGMRRLSVIDLQTGDQPIRNEDGSVWVVLNGEIYNYRELRRDLTSRGHVFSTSGDTETIVHLYEEYGVDCVDKLRGMYAFALWDARARQLLLARDRIGIKPLYYTVSGGRLIFASELKAILELPEIERTLNWQAVDQLFTFLVTPAAQSIIEGVKKLEPGHVLVAAPDREPRVSKYWDLRFEPDHSRSEAYFVARLRELLEESVDLHLASDVPLGAFLSGGIDSSAVVATAAGLTSGPVKTFSIGFADADYDESAHARTVAAHLGTEHHELVLEPNALDIVEELSWFLDEPFGDASAIPTYMVSKLAAEHVTVVLSGDGGDELFGGYDKYVVESREREYQVPAALRRMLAVASSRMPDGMRGRNFLHHFSLTGANRYLDAGTLFRRDAMQRLFRREVFAELAAFDPYGDVDRHLAQAPDHWLSALQYLDVKTLPPARHPREGRSHEHGTFDRGPRAVARPRARRIRRHHSAGAEASKGHDEVHPQASDAGRAPGRHHRSPQAGICRPPRTLVQRSARRLRARPPALGQQPAARPVQSRVCRAAAGATRQRSPARSAPLDADFLRDVVQDLPRPRACAPRPLGS